VNDHSDPRTYGEALDAIQAWQTASGLLVGDDPDGVTPAMLERYIERLSRVRIAAENLCRGPWGHLMPGLAALLAALEALPKDADEESASPTSPTGEVGEEGRR
jgi:hypothetical protein